MTGTMDRIEAAFDAYIRPFEQGTDEDRENIGLKRDHCWRVLDDARMIVAGAGLDDEAELAVAAAALLHDAGRFPQYAGYKTFDDSQSENHAKLGVRAILRGGLIRELSGPIRRTVLGTVFLHNVRSLPEGLPPLLDYAVRVVRDADKLDIMRVLCPYFEPDREYNPVVLLGTNPAPDRYTPEILAAVAEGRPADYRLMAWVNDFKLLLLSWGFAFNFAAARRAILDRGLFHRLIEQLPSGPQFVQAGEKALAALHDARDAINSP